MYTFTGNDFYVEKSSQRINAFWKFLLLIVYIIKKQAWTNRSFVRKIVIKYLVQACLQSIKSVCMIYIIVLKVSDTDFYKLHTIIKLMTKMSI